MKTNENETHNLYLPRDRDQDGDSRHCAELYNGGWWFDHCYYASPTSLSSVTKKNGDNYVTYYYGGDRGNGWDSWYEAEYLLVPN